MLGTKDSGPDNLFTYEFPEIVQISSSRHREGTVDIAGAKLTGPKLIIESGLSDEESTIYNLPDITDVQTAIDFAEQCGAKTTLKSPTDLVISNYGRRPLEDDLEHIEFTQHDQSTGIRQAGVDLVRFGEARIFNRLGGCNIGNRDPSGVAGVLEALGAEIEYVEHGMRLSAQKLSGATVNANDRVSATETVLAAATLAKGTTKIENAARTPEVDEQIKFLQKMGAKISHEDDPNDKLITVTGVNEDELHGCEHEVGPCRLEAASIAILAAMSESEIVANGAKPDDMEAFHDKFVEMGGGWDRTDSGIVYYRAGDRLSPANIYTTEYPGLDTDPAALLAAMSAYAIYEEGLYKHFSKPRGEDYYIYHDNRFNKRPLVMDIFRFFQIDVEVSNECGDDGCEFNGGDNFHNAVIMEPELSRSYLPLHIELPQSEPVSPKLNSRLSNTGREIYSEQIKSQKGIPLVPFGELRGGFGLLAFLLSNHYGYNQAVYGANVLSRGYAQLFEKLTQNLDMEIIDMTGLTHEICKNFEEDIIR